MSPKGRSSILFHSARAFHLAALSWFAFVFFWHFFSPQAKQLPGASGFGWFFR